MDKSRLDDDTVLVGFELPSAVTAQSVNLVGEFNGWAPDQHPLDLLDDGRFRTELPLPAGQRWRFRYVLDGERWENDWAADDYVPNGLGADDSVVDLTHPQGIPLSHLAAAAVDGDLTGDLTGPSTQSPAGAASTSTSDQAGAPSDDASGIVLTQPRRHWWQLWRLWRRKLTAA